MDDSQICPTRAQLVSSSVSATAFLVSYACLMYDLYDSRLVNGRTEIENYNVRSLMPNKHIYQYNTVADKQTNKQMNEGMRYL